ncbi:hypothetical protein TNCV_3946531 [Trichonephila clavipes]|nr:hypothetical protein TNCV_3946531 [Trichonephila clavipes]
MTAAREVAFHITSGSPTKEGRFILGTFRSERMRVLNRSRQNDRHCVMLLAHIDITPPQIYWSVRSKSLATAALSEITHAGHHAG